jgi:hypothetical protein
VVAIDLIINYGHTLVHVVRWVSAEGCLSCFRWETGCVPRAGLEPATHGSSVVCVTLSR